ncbi:MAG: membrane associated rhomboid family serine protease [Pirellulaceae bacterium]|jgi:membrane associated rhomboid family serine protease
MGIENRDYFRESSNYSAFGGGGLSPVCKWLMIITVVVYVAQIMIIRTPTPEDIQASADAQDEYIESIRNSERDGIPPDEKAIKAILRTMQPVGEVSIVEEWGELDTDKVMQGQVWRLISCAFLHSQNDFLHIVFNMLGLYWFGVTMESMYRSREFLYFYLTAAVVASLAYVALDLWTGDYTPAIGASGAVMAVMMLYAIHYPRQRLRMFFYFPLEARLVVFLYVLYDLHPVLLQLAGREVHTGTGHAAHLGGLAFGYVYWKSSLRLQRYYDKLFLPIHQWFRGYKAKQRGLSVYDPEFDAPARPPARPKTRHERRFDAQLDDILEKIHKEGKESLTEAEQKFLNLASERYRSDEEN